MLDAHFRRLQPLDRPTRVVVIRTNDLKLTEDETLIIPPALSVLLYRVDFDKVMRPAWAAAGAEDGRSYLPLDLHYLLTAWALNPEHEHHILGRALQVIDTTPILSGPMLDPSGDWSENETVQLCFEDMSTDDLMRTFDSLDCDFRLSIPVLARVVVVTSLEEASLVPVQTLVTGLVPPTA